VLGNSLLPLLQQETSTMHLTKVFSSNEEGDQNVILLFQWSTRITVRQK
jgi:hypothetical protein